MSAAPSRLIQTFLRQITYGGNDGIITTFAIVAGFAGAQAEGVAEIGALAVLVFGMANLISDAASMGLGEFLSDRSTRALVDTRKKEILKQDHPTRSARLAEVLVDKGLGPDEATSAAQALAKSPGLAAELTLRYRDDLEFQSGATPGLRGLVTFGSFVAFGLIPIFPFFLAPEGERTFVISSITTGFALLALGALRWRATGEAAPRAIGETVILGVICALLAFGTGRLVAGIG